eukprot:1231920-Alexandrium_andersonii.AAC.1
MWSKWSMRCGDFIPNNNTYHYSCCHAVGRPELASLQIGRHMTTQCYYFRFGNTCDTKHPHVAADRDREG